MRIHTSGPVLFHTDMKPLDAIGQELQPMQFVVIDEIPKPYYVDPDFATLERYGGCYGVISYYHDTQYYFDNKDHLGWVSPEGKLVCVRSRRIDTNVLLETVFWLPTSSLRRIPFNYPLAAAFASYRLYLEDNELGPEFMVVEGTEPFEKIKAVLEAPYETLVKAHAEVAGLL